MFYILKKSVFFRDNIVVHKSFVAISEILNHDAVTWRIFQQKIVQYIKANYKFVKTIIYFSDGACSQYKNKKNFINLTHHESDFGLKAEWNFFATAHGKGPCDGIGGTVKRLATRYCLQHPSENIRNAIEFYNWAVANIKNITFFYFANHLYNLTLDKCIDRFNHAVTIKGTQKFHRFLPMDSNKMLVKETSNSESHTIMIIKKGTTNYSASKH
ncbi:hypothetical protein CVS40_6527 [Lucilia cuprina]|nr:hypothetical protein CVS40_6527 [Lucilia cuprina]